MKNNICDIRHEVECLIWNRDHDSDPGYREMYGSAGSPWADDKIETGEQQEYIEAALSSLRVLSHEVYSLIVGGYGLEPIMEQIEEELSE